MFDMLLKSLGLTPEMVKEYIDKFTGKSQEYERRFEAMELKINSICEALNIPVATKED